MEITKTTVKIYKYKEVDFVKVNGDHGFIHSTICHICNHKYNNMIGDQLPLIIRMIIFLIIITSLWGIFITLLPHCGITTSPKPSRDPPVGKHYV